MTFPTRSKIAAVVVLFFLGTFAGQIQHLLDSVRGKVEQGAKVTADIRNAVDGVGDSASAAADEAARLRSELEALRDQVKAGTATPAQVHRIETIVKELDRRPGPSGPPGPQGAAGPPGPAAAAPAPAPTTTSTGPGSTTTTRQGSTTTSTRPGPSSTTTTTRCAVGIGQLLKVGC